VLLDDADLVLRTDSRDELREMLALGRTRSGRPATFVLSCQDPQRLLDLLPGARTHFLALTPQLVEVR